MNNPNVEKQLFSLQIVKYVTVNARLVATAISTVLSFCFLCTVSEEGCRLNCLRMKSRTKT